MACVWRVIAGINLAYWLVLIVAFSVARMYGAFAVITQVAVLHLTVAYSRHCYATNLCEWACS